VEWGLSTMRTASLLPALVLLGTITWAPSQPVLQAQEPTLQDQEIPLQDQAIRFAQAWVNGEGKRLEGMMAPQGIRLHLQGEEHLSIPPRQAGASLLAFLERYEGGEAEVFRVSHVGGDASRAFTEIRWGCRVSGTAEFVTFTLFVAFARTETGWMVTEIRILP